MRYLQGCICKSPHSFFFCCERGDAYQVTSFYFSGGLGQAGNILRFGEKKKEKTERKKKAHFMIIGFAHFLSHTALDGAVLEQCNPASEAPQLCSCVASPVPWEQGPKRLLKHILGESQWDWWLKRTMPTGDWSVSETWKGLSSRLSWANVAGDVCMWTVIPTVSSQPFMPEEKG